MYCVNPKVHCSQKNHQNLTAITAAIFPNSTSPFPGLSPYKNSTKNTNPLPVLWSQIRRPRPNRWMRSHPRSGLRNRHLTFPSTVEALRSRCTGLEGSIFKNSQSFEVEKSLGKREKSMVKCLGNPLFHTSSAMRFWVLG